MCFAIKVRSLIKINYVCTVVLYITDVKTIFKYVLVDHSLLRGLGSQSFLELRTTLTLRTKTSCVNKILQGQNLFDFSFLINTPRTLSL